MIKKIVSKKGRNVLCIALCFGPLLTGCSLLPVEESRPSLIVKSMERVDYAVEAVKREDLVDFKYIYCTYSQLKDESLSFRASDKKVEHVYVEVGSSVKAGDLLAELSLGDIDNEISNLTYIINLNTMKLNHMKKLKELSIEKESNLLNNGFLTREAYNNNVANINSSYHSEIQNLEDTLYIDGLKLEEQLEAREKGRIYAGMDGIVSFMKKDFLGSIPKDREDVIRIIDNSECAFVVETDFASHFVDGDIVSVEMRLDGGTIYETVVSHDETNPNIVYFKLLEPNFNLEVGDRGTITLILEEKKNVLTISKRALRKADEFYYVYYVNEDGIRSMKEVTIGMSTMDSYEITSGLEYGELVIRR